MGFVSDVPTIEPVTDILLRDNLNLSARNCELRIALTRLLGAVNALIATASPTTGETDPSALQALYVETGATEAALESESIHQALAGK